MSMRGLQINNPRRDGFLRSDTTLLDTFDIDRVEAIGGSNSLLFGSGDAGGVITSASKRAYLNRRPTMTWSATGDSEGSRRYTVDAQVGEKYFAVRFNGAKDDTKYSRPGLGRYAEGYHLTATVQPWKRARRGGLVAGGATPRCPGRHRRVCAGAGTLPRGAGNSAGHCRRCVAAVSQTRRPDFRRRIGGAQGQSGRCAGAGHP